VAATINGARSAAAKSKTNPRVDALIEATSAMTQECN
jgi:hypothetical protein